MEQLGIRVDEDLVLQLHHQKMAPLLFDLVEENRTHFREWLPWLDYNTKIEDTKKFIAECEGNYKKGISLNLGIYYQNQLVGAFGGLMLLTIPIKKLKLATCLAKNGMEKE